MRMAIHMCDQHFAAISKIDPKTPRSPSAPGHLLAKVNSDSEKLTLSGSEYMLKLKFVVFCGGVGRCILSCTPDLKMDLTKVTVGWSMYLLSFNKSCALTINR